MSSGGPLGVNEGAVEDHLEDASARANQLDLGFRVVLPHAGRQTGGSRFVVSDPAVLDAEMHRRLLILSFHRRGLPSRLRRPGSSIVSPHTMGNRGLSALEAAGLPRGR